MGHRGFRRGHQTSARASIARCSVCRAANGWRAKSSRTSTAGARNSWSTAATSSGGAIRAVTRRRQSVLEARQRHHAEAAAAAPTTRCAPPASTAAGSSAIGNHEVWGDPKIEGTLNAVPYLRKLGVTPENLIYKFDFRDSRFIFFWSGKYDYRSPSNWDADRPKYEEQIAHMKEWLDEAKAKGIPKVFITFHYPCLLPRRPRTDPLRHQSARASFRPTPRTWKSSSSTATSTRPRCMRSTA